MTIHDHQLSLSGSSPTDYGIGNINVEVFRNDGGRDDLIAFCRQYSDSEAAEYLLIHLRRVRSIPCELGVCSESSHRFC